MNCMIHNPWVGPSSYQDPINSVENNIPFCGRTNETYDLTNLIDDTFLVTLYGKSGNGKTSLLQAGVFPALRKKQYLPIMIRLGLLETDISFTDYIIKQIETVIKKSQGRIIEINIIPQQDEANTIDCLWIYFARHRFFDCNNNIVFPVLVFDQFEEMLREPIRIKQTELLLCQFNYLIDEHHVIDTCIINGEEYIYDFNFRIVISIREDELYRLENSIDNIYSPALKKCRYRLNALSDKDAEEIICIPGKSYLSQNHKKSIVKGIIKCASQNNETHISPFMLSLICSELFKKAYSLNTVLPEISLDLINTLGDDILYEFYVNAVKDLSDSERLFLENNIVDDNKMRNSINVGMMNVGCPSWKTLTHGQNRILQETNGKVELIHDMLSSAVFNARIQREELIHIKKKLAQRKKKMLKVFMIISSIVISIFASILIFQNIKLKNINWEMKANQSRAIAAKAIDLVNLGDTITAKLALLHALPEELDNPSRPYTFEAERGLRMASSEDEIILLGHTDNVNSVEYSYDNKYIISASDDQTIYMWNTESYNLEKKFIGHKGAVQYATISEDGKYIASFSNDDKSIIVWNVNNQKIHKIINTQNEITGFSFSHFGNIIAYSTIEHDIILVEIKTDSLVSRTFKGHNASVHLLSFNYNDKYLFSASLDNTFRIWDINTGEQIEAVDTHFGKISSFFIDGSGQLIYLSINSKDITFVLGFIGMDLKGGHTEDVNFATFSPDCQYAVSSSSDNSIILWKLTDDNHFLLDILMRFNNHSASVNYVSFSPDGTHIASASDDKTVRVWEFPPLQDIIDSTKEEMRHLKLTQNELEKYCFER